MREALRPLGEVFAAGQFGNAVYLRFQTAQFAENFGNGLRRGVFLPLEEDDVFYHQGLVPLREFVTLFYLCNQISCPRHNKPEYSSKIAKLALNKRRHSAISSANCCGFSGLT